ncbi:MAG: nucleoside triphosphate pyrophosphohydrolase [Rhodospirillaceae bacterium]
MPSAPKAPPRPVAAGDDRDIQELLAIMARLRDPQGGCPWDVEQTFASIAPYTIEEAYEVADAIARGNMGALKEELGDLLLQVVFHARMAEEAGLFDFADVVGAICDKMVHRHPHVFGSAKVDSAAAQTEAWEKLKAAERAAARDPTAPPSVLDGLPAGLPALKQAEKFQKRAARVGFDWTDAKDIVGKIQEELDEVRAEVGTSGAPRSSERLTDELGDLLFACVNLARKAEIDPGMALRGTNLKFERRFRRVEALLRAAGKSPEQASLEEMEDLWVRAKQEERGAT